MSRSWINRYENKHADKVVCPGFWRMRHIARCPHGCAYCFVPSTFGRFGFPKPVTEDELPAMRDAVMDWMDLPVCVSCGRKIKKSDKMLKDGMETYSRQAIFECRCGAEVFAPLGASPLLLNAGKFSDSFAPDISLQASLRLIELFRRQDRHTLLLVSKSNQAAEILRDVEPTNQVILSFSRGTRNVTDYEKEPLPEGYSLSPCLSYDGISTLAANGWRIRLRIDPITEKTDIRMLSKRSGQLLSISRIVRDEIGTIPIERITLGSLRATAAHFNNLRKGNEVQRALAALLVKDPNGGSHKYRLPVQQRVDLYGKAMEDLKGLAGEVALCKETRELYNQLDLEPERNLCNCML